MVELIGVPIAEIVPTKKALAQHLASLVNNEEWADVEFVLDADGDKRIYAYERHRLRVNCVAFFVQFLIDYSQA